jgi:hypothetical protein
MEMNLNDVTTNEVWMTPIKMGPWYEPWELIILAFNWKLKVQLNINMKVQTIEKRSKCQMYGEMKLN